MHRESFFLAVNFFDRYLSATTAIPKSTIQAVGLTCLFIAAKMQVSAVSGMCLVRQFDWSPGDFLAPRAHACRQCMLNPRCVRRRLRHDI